MIEILVRLERGGTVLVPGGVLPLGYAGNRGIYQLRVEPRGEWKGLIIRANWHTPDMVTSTLIQNGIAVVPAIVTAKAGAGCVTFEGTDGTHTVTSADAQYRVQANSGTVDETMPDPDSPAWEEFIRSAYSMASDSEVKTMLDEIYNEE